MKLVVVQEGPWKVISMLKTKFSENLHNFIVKLKYNEDIENIIVVWLNSGNYIHHDLKHFIGKAFRFSFQYLYSSLLFNFITNSLY